METVIDIILAAGHSALDVSLYTLLPIMVVMTIVLRLLEVYGVLKWVIALLDPVIRPFGLQGLGGLAILQSTLISFVAPLPTLKMIESRGTSDRILAASFAGVLASAPANATYPLSRFGLSIGLTVCLSIFGALIASTSTYWIFGRKLTSKDYPSSYTEIEEQTHRPSLVTIINTSGGQAVQSILAIIPMLLVSLAVVFALEKVGLVAFLTYLLSGSLAAVGIDANIILPTVTKYLAGNSAMVAVLFDMAKQPGFNPAVVSRGSGFLINPLDLPGLGIFATAGPRLIKVIPYAMAGGAVGIAMRAVVTPILM